MTPSAGGWQVEGTSAELYERYLVPTVTLPWARDLVERVGLSRGAGIDPAERARVVERVQSDITKALTAFTREGTFVFPQRVHAALADSYQVA